MSDVMQGPGWWQATDGRWYPPELRPGFAPPPPQGYPQMPLGIYPQPTYPVPVTSNTMATTGGVVGISGAVLSLIPILGILIGLVSGILAIIFSSIGLNRSSQFPAGKGMAITGLVLGILTVIFKLIPGVNVL